MSIQVEFFQKIKERLPENLSLVNEVAELMEVSNDSAYRRIRGETELTFEEIKTLCKRFNISLDSVIGSTSSTVNFHYKPMNESEFSYVNYMETVLKALSDVEQEKDKEIIYISNDIPFFHTFNIPEVAAFKAFVWQKTVLDYEGMSEKKFELGQVDDQLRIVSRGLRDTYNKIPSIEIFHPGTIDVTLAQIEYYSIAGLFKNWKDAILICDKLHELVNHLESQAKMSHKFHPRQELPEVVENNYTLYYNDVLYIEDAVLVRAGNVKTVYLINMTLNSLITHSTKFYDNMHKTIQNLMTKSSLISGVSEKERSRIFVNYRKKIDHLKDKINS
jgi:hypothetical protein